MDDFNLWDFVKQTITPLSEPKRPRQPIVMLSESKEINLDLHDKTLNEAYVLTISAIKEAQQNNQKLRIITGRSGEIRREFPLWMETNMNVKSCRKDWHGGSFVVRVK